jgi:hypothetical protein
MSFWSTSTGESALSVADDYEISGGGNLEPIPNDTKVLGMIEKATWRSPKDSNAEYIETVITVLKPEAYLNHKLYFKWWVKDLDQSVKDKEGRFDEKKAVLKKDKALNNLAKMDRYSGGSLANLNDYPTDEDLRKAFSNKVMVFGCKTWDDRETKKPAGNWCYYVGAKTDAITEVAKAQVAKPSSSASTASRIDDEIPF